jgi:molybdopterin converting factor small subunit
MQAQIYVYGFLKNIVPSRFRHPPVALEFDSPITVYKVLTVILGLKTLDSTVLVNGKIVNTDYTIQDGDEVHITPPIAGG